MNYQKHYDTLILRAKTRLDCAGYVENHHIIPKCMNGDDSPDNLVKLTAREHFVAHALLAKIHKGTPGGYKLISAFRFMTVDSHGGARNNNRDYAWMRKMYSENHPFKQPSIVEKMKLTTAVRRAAGLYDGVAEKRKTTTAARRAAGVYGDERRVERVALGCKCGCGQKFEKKVNDPKVYIMGHEVRVRYNDPLNVEKQSNSLRSFVESLTDEERKIRWENSCGKADLVARGKAISLAKKGKKTNQREIEIQKYGKMTEEELETFLKDRTKSIQTRTRNKRKIYFDRINNS